MERRKVKEERNIISLIDKTEETINVGIDENSIDLIIDRLTDMYQDPIASTVRELVSNGLDACLETGGRVFIRAPRKMRNLDFDDQLKFEVEDEGTGMSIDEIRNIYTKYGASTKRDDMNQIGAFGLGAKVPLAYTNAFFIETTKNGETIEASLSREKNKTTFKVNNISKTNKKSGTKITVYLKNENDVYHFNKAIDIYKRHAHTLKTELIFE